MLTTWGTVGYTWFLGALGFEISNYCLACPPYLSCQSISIIIKLSVNQCYYKVVTSKGLGKLEIAKIEFTKLLWNWFPNLFLLQIIKDIISGMDFSQILLPCVSSFYILTAWRSRTNALTTTQCLKMTQNVSSKNVFVCSTLISRENCRVFWGEKPRENVAVLDFLAVDNFDFTRKIIDFFGEKLVKMLWFWAF